MKISTSIVLFLCVHLTTAQLNFEGNPLTDNTDYLAEESSISERTSRQNKFQENTSEQKINQVSQKLTPQKLYPVYGNNTNDVPQNKVSKSVQNTETVKTLKLVPAATSRQFQDNFINTNVVQEQKTINPADLALQIFMNSKTPKESEVALNYYLQGGQGLAEQLELQKQQQQQQIREKELQQEQYFKQQQLQQEQLLQKQKQQKMQQEQQLLLQSQQEQQILQQKAQLEQERLHQEQLFNQNHQQNQFSNVQQNQFGNIQQNQFPNYQQNQQDGQIYQNQFQPNEVMQPNPGYYPYSSPRIPLFQSRNDVMPGVPIYRRPIKRTNYRQPVPLQSRVNPVMYKGPPPPPPSYPGKLIKPPMEMMYSRPPTYARGAPIISNPPVFYEDANPWFGESDHKPPSKDIYYSQLYAQSYDPHYYNYIAKTGKIKPYLYGKLNKEEKQDDGILAELFRGFTKHGMKNIMNPTFLLGMTIPALTFMLTALVQKRSLARSDSRSLNEDEFREYLERLQRALECHRNLKVPSDDRCWR